jgi:predicted DNA-binding transcriptional regulator YafY
VTSKAALRSAFRVWRGGHLTRVRIRFASGVAAEIEERRWHPSQRLERVSAPTCAGEATAAAHSGVDLTIEVAGLAEVKRWVLGFGAAAQVLEPTAAAERYGQAARHPRGRGRRRKFDLT